MSFVSSIVVVDDVIHSRELFEGILKLKVIADFGIYNVGFEGGLALYKKTLFKELVGDINIVDRSNNFVLYFEVDDLDRLESEIEAQDFEFLHKIREQPWRQRIFRFYDYDNHILEIAERMDVVSYRLFQENKSMAEISELTGVPVDQVVQEIRQFENRKNL